MQTTKCALTPGFALGYTTEDFLSKLGAVAHNEHGSEGLDQFARGLLEKLETYRANPVNGNLVRVKGALNEMEDLHKIVKTQPDLRLTGIGVNPGLKDIEDLDAVAVRVSSGKKVIFEFKRGQTAARPSGDQKKKFVKQITNRISLAKKPGHDLSGAEIRVWLSDSPVDWSPSLKQELESLGTQSGVTVVLERAPQ